VACGEDADVADLEELITVPPKNRCEYVVVGRGDHRWIIVLLLAHVHNVELEC